MTDAGPDALVAAADALALAGEAFARPGADVRARAAALVRERPLAFPPANALRASLAALAAAPAGGLDVEYVRLFLHGRPATAHPYESFYRSGRLMDPECLDELAGLYAAAGVAPEIGGVPPDHLSVEAEFLALLLRGLAGAGGDAEAATALRAIAGELIASHLAPFVAAFRERVASLAPAPYFAAASDALTGALAAGAEALRAATPRASSGRC